VEELHQQLLTEVEAENSKLKDELTTESELVDIKDRRIDDLTTKVDKLTKENKQKLKQIILLIKQLGEDQSENKILTKLLTKCEREVVKLEKVEKKSLRTKQYQQNRTNNLATESNSLKIQLAYFKTQDENLRTTIQDLQG
jgi:Trp operon repressor